MPGLLKNGHIILKNAVFRNDESVWEWFEQKKRGFINPADMTVTLMADDGTVVQSFKYFDARPVGYTLNGFSTDDENVLMDRIEMVYSIR